MPKRWVIAEPDPVLSGTLAGALGMPLALAQALINRGFTDVDSARRYLQPQLRDLADPFLLPGMAAATDRIQHALSRREKTVIYGDYDVDGITASAMLQSVLSRAGGVVSNFLPHRMDEGYGLTEDALARCARDHRPGLLIAVDCGTGSVKEIAELRRQGIAVIVVDHHEPGEALPDAVALVNPKLAERATTEFASVGLAFKLCHALLKRDAALAGQIDMREYLDLVAIGTVADVVPLTGENRILTRAGLKKVPDTGRVGLRSLMNLAGVRGDVTPYDVGFMIGPRLNAAGRLGDAMAALELLLTADEQRAGELAQVLHDHNAERQQVEKRMLEEALAMASERDLTRERVLVLAKEGWHPGVVGIVASRVQSAFSRPAVVIGVEDGVGKGSCRSVSGFSVVDALRHCDALLERCGGHDMAAGLTVKAGNVEALRAALNDYAKDRLSDEDLAPRLRVDAWVRLADLGDDFLAGMEKFEPCGPSNPSLVFGARGVHLAGPLRVLKQKHLRFPVTDGAETLDAVWWRPGALELPGKVFDIAFSPEINEYQGVESVRLNVRDVRAVG